jgi:hypothetical protein
MIRQFIVLVRGLQRDVVYLGWPIAPSYISPNALGGGELRGLSQWVQLYTGAQITFGDPTPYLTYGSCHRSAYLASRPETAPCWGNEQIWHLQTKTIKFLHIFSMFKFILWEGKEFFSSNFCDSKLWRKTCLFWVVFYSIETYLLQTNVIYSRLQIHRWYYYLQRLGVPCLQGNSSPPNIL